MVMHSLLRFVKAFIPIQTRIRMRKVHCQMCQQTHNIRKLLRYFMQTYEKINTHTQSTYKNNTEIAHWSTRASVFGTILKTTSIWAIIESFWRVIIKYSMSGVILPIGRQLAISFRTSINFRQVSNGWTPLLGQLQCPSFYFFLFLLRGNLCPLRFIMYSFVVFVQTSKTKHVAQEWSNLTNI